jgi:hypothetical protein
MNVQRQAILASRPGAGRSLHEEQKRSLHEEQKHSLHEEQKHSLHEEPERFLRARSPSLATLFCT